MLRSDPDRTMTRAFGFAPSLGNAAPQVRQDLVNGNRPTDVRFYADTVLGLSLDPTQKSESLASSR